MPRFGYACINSTLQKEKNISCNKGMIKRTWLAKGLPYASQISLSNVKSLKKIIQWNNDNGVSVYRMSSCIFPWFSEYRLEDLPDFEEINSTLKQAGNLAKKNNQRLSFHPGQFCVMASPKENVVVNAARELNNHSHIMNLMGLPKTPQAKINIHVGGAYGNREEAMDRFCKNFDKYLNDCTKSRLTVENDDKPNCFSTKMLFDGVHKQIGIPIVFDSHHFELGPQGMDYRDSFYLARSTWKNGIRQQCHHSNSKKLYEDETAAKVSHSNWYYKPFISFIDEVDVVLECKSKELGLFKYLKDFGDKPYDIPVDY